MVPKKVQEGVKEVMHLLEKTDLRIDEKIAICRAAGDVYNQIFITETFVVSMQRGMETNKEE